MGCAAGPPWSPARGGNELLGAFGFTGELQDGDTSVVYLRARWYNPGSGTFTTRDPFAGFPIAPLSLHPSAYVGNNPVTLTDPLGQCSPPLGWLRDLAPGNCSNLAAAIQIATHPHVAPDEYALAASSIVAFTGSHALLVVGAGILTWQAIAAAGGVVTAISQWGAAYLAAHPGTAVVAGGTLVAANVADNVVILLSALAGDPYSANEIHMAQQLAASDGFAPLGDLLACAALLPRLGRPGANFISLGRNYTDHHLWWKDGRARESWGRVQDRGGPFWFPFYFEEAADNAEVIYFDLNKVSVEAAFRQGNRIYGKEVDWAAWEL